MNNLIMFDFNKGKAIEVSKVRVPKRALNKGLISPPKEETIHVIANDHTSEPLKSLDDIQRISDWFIDKKRYRDNMMFIVGINFGLRVSDLLLLRFDNLLEEVTDPRTGEVIYQFKTSFPILEKKTSTTRKVKKNRYITINEAVMDSVSLFLEKTSGVSLSDYMFKCEGNRGKNSGKPLHRSSVDNIIKEVCEELKIESKVSTHTLRKTFAYHQMLMSNNDPRKLLLLQKILGHSSASQTLAYIGITNEEISEAYMELNLGIRKTPSLVDSSVTETNLEEAINI